MLNDYIIQGTAKNGLIRAFCATTRDIVEEARRIHNLTPVTAAACGRLLSAAAIMGAMLKNDKDLLTIQIKSTGPIGGIVVTSDSQSNVKGYVFNPNVELPPKPNGKIDVSGGVGEGSLSVIKDLGLKEPYIGQVPIQTGEMAQDLTYYYAKSEQIPSAIALGVLVDRDYTIKQSGGFFIQLMPGADESVISELEDKIKNIRSITTMLDSGMTPYDILTTILDDFNMSKKIPTKYYCNCSRSRVEKAFVSIGIEEMTDILNTDKKATLHCHFCNKEYNFNEEDIEKLITEAGGK